MVWVQLKGCCTTVQSTYEAKWQPVWIGMRVVATRLAVFSAWVFGGPNGNCGDIPVAELVIRVANAHTHKRSYKSPLNITEGGWLNQQWWLADFLRVMFFSVRFWWNKCGWTAPDQRIPRFKVDGIFLLTVNVLKVHWNQSWQTINPDIDKDPMLNDDPYHPCMVYLPTFTIKINQM